MLKIIRRALSVIGALGALCLVGFALEMWNFKRPPFDIALLKQLRPGMTQDEVRKILGASTSEHENSWVYARFLGWSEVDVFFDDNKRFRESDYDY